MNGWETEYGTHDARTDASLPWPEEPPAVAPLMHLHVLASGSKGNAAVVEGPEGSVLIDDGLSRRELMRRADELGVDMDRVGCVIVTHEHSDHTSGLSVLCNKYEGRLVATAGTAGGRKYLAALPFELVGASDELEACGMRVRTFPTSHDVADPFGLRFDCASENGADSLGFCTDTGVLGQRAMTLLRGVRILALESNHDARMLATGPYPAVLKARVAGDHGHLSNDQAAGALRELVGPATETVVAMHLSQENNRPSVAVRTLAAAVGAQAANDTFTEARTPDGALTICAAGQDRPLTIW
ncbi:MBL fold metallo-hydrolase [Parolsenella catena]|uniref:MBL fold metallo-hydrolase n=1 Tax=Parolsenella catena TaxID=2003188 RepID=UPI003F995D54